MASTFEKPLSSRSLIKKLQMQGCTEAAAVNWAMRVKLKEVQEEIGKLFEQEEEKKFQIQNRIYRKQKSVYEKRSKLILERFNNFWSETLLSHPDIREIVLPGEEKCLQFLEDLTVVPFQRVEYGYRIELLFRKNLYFSNEKLVKEFQLTRSRNSFQATSSSTKIIWKKNRDLTKKRSKTKKGFFKWFLDNSDPEEDEISEVIKDEIWTDPLPYAFPNYTRGQGECQPKKEIVEIEESEVVPQQGFCPVSGLGKDDDDPITMTPPVDSDEVMMELKEKLIE